ncbi:hypothetical protein H5410_062849 [Solanum commersonii]|uniref:Uncharacterized protein n=1 Tax=Solanum commersonii TaxID=4109 RepID=A0A9J5WBJ0_SOLCO|nr:hypothetical protein H5410_062849 [Solanum commersonii]
MLRSFRRRRFQWTHQATSEGYDDISFWGQEQRRSPTPGWRTFGLVIANSSFPKKEDTWIPSVVRKGDKRLCKGSKVIPSENLMTQNELLGPSDGFEDQEREEEEDEREVDAYGGLGSSVAVCGIGLLDALGKRQERCWGLERSFWSASRD